MGVGTHLCALSWWAALACAVAPSVMGCAPEPPGPYLQDLQQDKAVIAWDTDGTDPTWIEYGLTSEYGDRIDLSGHDGLHEVELSDLASETTYHYRIGRDGHASRDFEFRTLGAKDASFRFAVYGDSQSAPNAHRAIANAIVNVDPSIVLHVGDEVQDGTDEDSWAYEFFGPARTMLARVPVYVAMGNHEYDAAWFYYYHSYPAPENYYAVEHGNGLFLILDTNTDYGEGSPQQQWLRSQLQSARQGQRRWLWVAFHHPAYSEGWSPCEQDGDEGVRSQLIPLLEEAGVNVVFNGHVHGYERGMLHGVHYVTTGGGGGILDKSCGDWPHISVARYEHHFVTVDVHGTEAYVVAHAIDGTILDSFTVSQGSGS